MHRLTGSLLCQLLHFQRCSTDPCAFLLCLLFQAYIHLSLFSELDMLHYYLRESIMLVFDYRKQAMMEHTSSDSSCGGFVIRLKKYNPDKEAVILQARLLSTHLSNEKNFRPDTWSATGNSAVKIYREILNEMSCRKWSWYNPSFF